MGSGERGGDTMGYHDVSPIPSWPEGLPLRDTIRYHGVTGRAIKERGKERE